MIERPSANGSDRPFPQGLVSAAPDRQRAKSREALLVDPGQAMIKTSTGKRFGQAVPQGLVSAAPDRQRAKSREALLVDPGQARMFDPRQALIERPSTKARTVRSSTDRQYSSATGSEPKVT